MGERLFTLFLFSAIAADAAQWVVIVATSAGYRNYRHQADACHAYQLARQKGVPEDRIILMMYDDVARDPANPFPNKLFNRPDPHGPGRDVYAGCKVDYKGDDVNPDTFIDVLTGKGPGKSLKSTSHDHVFITLIDHGAPGFINFELGTLHRMTLQHALQQMHEAQMFNHLVFYLDTCYSGSMFEGLAVPGVYAVSASNSTEFSYTLYCPGPPGHDSGNIVDGRPLGTCLGDVFSMGWMEDSEANDSTKETLDEQLAVVKRATTKSHVMQFGDRRFVNDTISEYFGNGSRVLKAPQWTQPVPTSLVPVHQLDLHMLRTAYDRATSHKERQARWQELQQELASQEAVKSVFRRFVRLAYPGEKMKQEQAWTRTDTPNSPECELAGHEAIRAHCARLFDANSGFALSFHQVVVNVCADIAQGLHVDVIGLGAQACDSSRSVIV